MPDIRVLLIDDHEIVRFGIRTMLEAEGGFTVVAEGGDGGDAVRLAAAHRPDVVLMDIRMGAMDGIEACRQLKAAAPECRVLMLTSFGTEDAVRLRQGFSRHRVASAN